MNIYRALKLIGLNSIPAPLKLLGLWGLMVTGRRMAGVFFDPVLACNLRCRMCYFSDPERRKSLKGVISDVELKAVEEKVLPRAAKLQIGCGAEPTLYSRLVDIVAMGRRAKVPYISLTTNGQLIDDGRVDIRELAVAGLDELTLSMHGTRAETYEYLMPGARFEALRALLSQLAELQKQGMAPKVRVNFTVNSMNVSDLEGDKFWQVWDDAECRPDIVQLRPVQKIGESDWVDFNLEPLKSRFESTIGNVVAECKRRGVTCIAPTIDALQCVDTPQSGVESLIEDITYCYVAPKSFYKEDFNPEQETFSEYHRRKHTARRLLKAVFCGASGRGRRSTKKLNYRVR